MSNKIEDHGEPTGATFSVERIDGAPTIQYDSRGTSEGTRAYRRGLVLLLQRLTAGGVTLAEICIETRTTAHLDRTARRLTLPAPWAYPFKVATETEKQANQLRAAIHTAASRACRAPGAKGGGNGTKRLRIYLRTRKGIAEIERLISIGD